MEYTGVFSLYFSTGTVIYSPPPNSLNIVELKIKYYEDLQKEADRGSGSSVEW